MDKAYARDKFWMFGVRPHQDDIWLKPAEKGSKTYRYRSRRIDGIIFEANSVMGVGLESERWLSEWVDKVQDTIVP